MKYINRIGVELEGGWKKKPIGLYADGSVTNIDNMLYEGEIHSSPLTHAKIIKWVEKNYPNEVNHSCGLHIHISLKNNLLYSKLITPRFHTFLKQKFNLWGKEKEIVLSSFWNRLVGNNSYCKDNYQAEKQLDQKEKSSIRYTHINYCYALHGTVEFRLLPMFKMKNIAIEAISFLQDIVKEWLDNNKKEQSIKILLQMNEEEKITIEEVV